VFKQLNVLIEDHPIDLLLSRHLETQALARR
jgi:hypothetical protein